MALRPPSRLIFLLPAIICLVAGVLTGLARVGVPTPEFIMMHTGSHSILMISGFFGTVIGLERAVATRRVWSYWAPLLSGIGGLVLLSGSLDAYAPILFTLAAFCFVFSSIMVVAKQPAIYTVILLIAATLWLIGNALWFAGGSAWVSIPYGLSFLVLTIAGERLELTRFLPPRRFARAAFILVAGLLIGSTIVSGATSFTQNAYLGFFYAGLALWLIVFDIARTTIRQTGITRFVAVCLLSGYFWLFAGGFLLTEVTHFGSLQRDAAIHAVTLGFIFAMVMGHAPVIFPAVTRLAIPFSNLFYLPLLLLNLGVALRLLAPLVTNDSLREAGAEVNALAILTFFLSLIFQVSQAMRRQ